MAWLGFIAFDDLERIWEISRYDPVFGEMYHDLSEFRRKPGEVLGMFSEALIQLDQNDAKYYAETLRKKAAKLEKKTAALETKLQLKDDEIAGLRKSKDEEIAGLRKSKDVEIAGKDDEIAELRRRIEQLESRQ